MLTSGLVGSVLANLFVNITYRLANSQQRERLINQALERKNHMFQSLLDSSVILQNTDQLNDLLASMLERLRMLFPQNQFGIIIDSSRPTMIRQFAGLGITADEKACLLELNAFLLEKNQRHDILARLRQHDEHISDRSEWDFLAMTDRAGKVLGKLVIKGTLPLDSHEVFQLLLKQFSTATENKLLSLELEKLANTDDLTGVYNRSFFNRELSRQIEIKYANLQQDFCIILADLNGLKTLNDKMGHMAGDSMIIACARLLQNCCRSEDFVCRTGGDEFAVLSPATKLEQGHTLLQRLQEKQRYAQVNYQGAQHYDNVVIPLSLSFGLACSMEVEPELVYRLADQRMYEAKNHHYAVQSLQAAESDKSEPWSQQRD
jgi:diguanylate cyclase (GGDEF)-like protein